MTRAGFGLGVGLGFGGALVGVPLIPAYDVSLSDSLDDGHETGGSSLYTTAGTTHSLVDQTEDFHIRTGFCFPGVAVANSALVISATLYLYVETETTAGTWDLRGQNPTAAGLRLSNTAGNRPSDYAVPGTFIAGPRDLSSSVGLKAINVTTLVQLMLNDADWASGDYMNFLCNPVEDGVSLAFTSSTGAITANRPRLVITVSSAYPQNRVHNAGIRALERVGTLTGITNGTQFTFSCWLKRDVPDSHNIIIVAHDTTADQARFSITVTKDARRIRVRYATAGVNTGLLILANQTISDRNWHYLKIVCDLDEDYCLITLDGVTEDYPPSFYPEGGGGGVSPDFNWTTCNRWLICEDELISDAHNGGISDLVFSNSILAHSSLSYNGGVPLDISGVSSLIKVTNKAAADYQAGTANSNGTGGAFLNYGTANTWYDLQGGTPSYSQNRVANGGGTRYLNRAANLTGIADSATFTFSCWFRRVATGLVHSLIVGHASSVGRLTIQFTAANALRLSYVNGLGQSLDYTSTLVVADTNWHYVKVACDLGADSGTMTLDAATDTFAPSASISGGSMTTFNFSVCTGWRILAAQAGALIYNVETSDMVFNHSLLTHAALSYNGGVPLDPEGVTALINTSSASARSIHGGYVNNGSGTVNPFVSTPSADGWTNV